MKARKSDCDNCKRVGFQMKPVQVRQVFGIHTGAKPVFSVRVYHWCGRCRAVGDGKWRYAKEK